MPKEIELGDLEFKPEDFACDGVITSATVILTPWIAAERANRRLRAKIAKAPEVQSNWKVGKYDWCEINRVGDTHRGRLVCIEEIEEEK